MAGIFFMDNSAPIGVFDSGIGGLSVFRELTKVVPEESMIYVADSANAPYGTKSRRFITNRCRAISRFLVAQGCKLIVVACNTATGASISTLRREFSIPFIGVEPAVKPAAIASKTGHVGILATAQTFKGEHFRRSIGLYAKSVNLHEAAGTGLVELIENGMIDSPESRRLLSQYLMPMVDQGIDQLVLGCTHYPFLIPVIREILPAGIQIIDPAPAVARQTRKVLEQNNYLNSSGVKRQQFYTSGSIEKFTKVLTKLAGGEWAVNQLVESVSSD
jgi:glutamate racemase